MNTYTTKNGLCVRYLPFAASANRFIGQIHVQGSIEGGTLDVHFTCDAIDASEGAAIARARNWAEHHYPHDD